MRFLLLVLLSAFCLPASAQWNPFKTKKKFVRPETEQLTCSSVIRFAPYKIPNPKVSPVVFDPSDYAVEAAEAVVMKVAQHNMRFRVYHDASYNFTELAHLYVQENRYSEAIWYLLQSNNISRQESDDKHTVENLIDIATIKAKMGEITLAQQDLDEARDLAYSKGLTQYLETIELAGQYITQNKLPKQKPALIYADGAQNNGKAE
ncbi:MAG TPA: hypothetical protein VFE53_15300 [Mucilaginibacter sp.]|jgi:hypothetical protein|nr:hypothetical protein [Mucilaginibacter sp.]